MGYARIRPKRGTATQWTSANTVLAEGEWGVEVPTDGVGSGLVNIKIGDGSTAWNDLPYALKACRIANNLTTEEEGFVLDARQGKTLNDNLKHVESSDNLVMNSNLNFIIDEQKCIKKNGSVRIRFVLSNCTVTNGTAIRLFTMNDLTYAPISLCGKIGMSYTNQFGYFKIETNGYITFTPYFTSTNTKIYFDETIL